MSLRELPARPNLEHLKKQARKLLREFLQDDPAAVDRFREAAVAAPAGSAPRLADALHVIALEYGFDSWPKLKARVETLAEDPAEALKAAIRADDAALVREVIARHPVLKTKIDEPLPDFNFDSPALIGAVNKGNRAMIDALLEAGQTSTRERSGGREALACWITAVRSSRPFSSSAGQSWTFMPLLV